MPYAIRFHETGGPEVLRVEQVDVGAPGPGQARVRHAFVALNFIDIYFRTGRYPLALPNGLGSDAVGVVEEVGPGVTDVKRGRSRRLSDGPAGRLLGRASDARRRTDPPCPTGVERQHRRDADDEGHDGAVPVPSCLPAQGRREHHPVPRGCRRRGFDRLPVGQGPWVCA